MKQDVRHALRAIARMPGLAAVVVLSLGVGIGVNTVVFSWIQAVLFQPIPGVADGSRFHLVEPRTTNGVYVGTSWLEYADLRSRVTSMRDLLAFRMAPLYVGKPGEVERAYGLLVSGNYFQSLGLRPALGRLIQPEETDAGRAEPIAVISHDYWHVRFAGSPDAIGQSLRVNGRDLTIVGVAPRGFLGTVFRLEFDIWMPATLAPALFDGTREIDNRGARGYSVIGRLAPSTSRDIAEGELAGIMREMEREFPDNNTGLSAEVLPFSRPPRGPQRFLATALTFLQIVMLLLLLTVCGNTANLMLARASARQREMGVRLALGAGRLRIARLLLAESVLLAAMGAALGVLIAMWGTRALSATPLTLGFPVNFETSIDRTALLFAMLLGGVCGLAFGLAPAIQLARIDPQLVLRTGASPSGRSQFRNVLMAVQVALALVVLVAAGLFLRSFLETQDTYPGFRREGVLLATYDLTGRRSDDESARRFAAAALERVKGIPGVEAAAISAAVPLDIHGLPSRAFTVDGYTRSEAGDERALTNTVTPGYFALMAIPILSGSDFADLRDAAAPAQAIVNETFVRRYLDRVEPLGRRLQLRGRELTIVGVVRTSLNDAFGETPAPVIYLSYRDSPMRAGEMHLRTRDGSEAALTPHLRKVFVDLDPELPLYNVRTLAQHVETNLLFRRIPARMFVVLGPMLLALAAIGIYASVAYSVSQRTTEVGVRLALGATPTRIVSQLVSESLAVVSVGAMAGWLIAFLGAPLVIGSRVDLTIFLGVPAILLLVAAIACWLPANRAAALDPMGALRNGE